MHLPQQLHVELLPGPSGATVPEDVRLVAAARADIEAHVLYDAQRGTATVRNMVAPRRASISAMSCAWHHALTDLAVLCSCFPHDLLATPSAALAYPRSSQYCRR